MGRGKKIVTEAFKWYGLAANGHLSIVQYFLTPISPTIHDFPGDRKKGYEYTVVELKLKVKNIIEVVKNG